MSVWLLAVTLVPIKPSQYEYCSDVPDAYIRILTALLLYAKSGAYSTTIILSENKWKGPLGYIDALARLGDGYSDIAT